MGHAFSLDQRLLHVPLVAAGPGVAAAPEIRSLVELPALIAGAAGLDRHPWGEALGEAVAVAQFEPPAPADHPKWVEAFDEWGLDPEVGAERVAVSLAAATDGELKLERRGDRELLFDLGRDSLEREPLDPSRGPAGQVAALRDALGDQGEGPVAPPAPSPEPAEISAAERAQLEERMKLLGYM